MTAQALIAGAIVVACAVYAFRRFLPTLWRRKGAPPRGGGCASGCSGCSNAGGQRPAASPCAQRPISFIDLSPKPIGKGK